MALGTTRVLGAFEQTGKWGDSMEVAQLLISAKDHALDSLWMRHSGTVARPGCILHSPVTYSQSRIEFT